MKLFRKIRRELLSEGKTRKYLAYALGEIVLVVIGILIALQINNWNEKEQLKGEELKTLKSLKESIKINIGELHTALNAQIRRNQSLQEVLFTNITKHPVVYLDSIIISNVRNHTFDPSTGIYNAMINSGRIELISNDSLKNRISKLYDRVKDYQESEDEITAYTQAHLEPYFIENYSIDPGVLAKIRKRTAEEEVRDKASYAKTFASTTVKNMYIMLLNKMNDVITKGQYLETEYLSLVSDLDEETNSKTSSLNLHD
ncbi:MAG: DUF6090 family protein [Bacteroidota bacterium]